MSLSLATPTATLTEDETFTIHGLSWDQYVAIGEALGDQAGLRTLYLDGSLTFVSPQRKHEWSGTILDKIIHTIAIGCEIEIDDVGSTTLRKENLRHGLEGDHVYYLRANAALMIGPQEIDLTIDPPPDLAVEVENSNKADEAMAIYTHLGVPEVWRYDVRRNTLTFWSLRSDGVYQSVPHSPGFPFLTPADVLFQLQLAAESHSHNRWFRQLNTWVQDVIRPRLAGDTP